MTNRGRARPSCRPCSRTRSKPPWRRDPRPPAPAIEVRGVRKSYERRHRARRRRPHRPPRRGARPARTQRRRQDDAGRDPRGPPQRRRRRGRRPRLRPRPARARVPRARRHRPPGRGARAGADRARGDRAVRRAPTRTRCPRTRSPSSSASARSCDARTRTLSGGQRRRLDVAVGIAGDPELIFLDEPTTGFDPAARRQSWELIAGLRARGRTILLTTHYMEEAQRLADRVAVLADGRLIAVGTPDELGRRRRGAW